MEKPDIIKREKSHLMEANSIKTNVMSLKRVLFPDQVRSSSGNCEMIGVIVRIQTREFMLYQVLHDPPQMEKT